MTVAEEILTSKKYASLYKPLVERICEEESKKYTNRKEQVKAAKNTLHSMYGAYLSNDIYKKAGKLMDSKQPEGILPLHASTKERLRDMQAFYDFIFEATGKADIVLDIGCGFNPFTLPYWPHKPAEYHAIDLDERIAEINNRYLTSQALPALAICGDAAVQTPAIPADTAFLFKLLPLLDRQAKGRSAALLRELNARNIVVTYPIKSLSGKEKGMRTFYASAFREITADDFTVIAEREIGMELVYVVTKNQAYSP